MNWNAFLDQVFLFCQMTPPPLTLGWKNEKQPFGPTELDLEAGNLVLYFHFGKHSVVGNVQWSPMELHSPMHWLPTHFVQNPWQKLHLWCFYHNYEEQGTGRAIFMLMCDVLQPSLPAPAPHVYLPLPWQAGSVVMLAARPAAPHSSIS